MGSRRASVTGVPILLWALLASGQIRMRKVNGWETLSRPIGAMPLDLAA